MSGKERRALSTEPPAYRGTADRPKPRLLSQGETPFGRCPSRDRPHGLGSWFFRPLWITHEVGGGATRRLSGATGAETTHGDPLIRETDRRPSRRDWETRKAVQGIENPIKPSGGSLTRAERSGEASDLRRMRSRTQGAPTIQ